MLGLRGYVPGGDPGRAEARGVVEGVEVPVLRRAGIAGLGGPHPVGDFQVAAEAQHVRVADRPRGRGVPAQRGPVHDEVPDAGGRVHPFEAWCVSAFRRPDPDRRSAQPQPCVGQPDCQLRVRDGRLQQRLERVGGRAAEHFQHPCVEEGTQHRGQAAG